jgi:putative endonuclease
MFHVYVLRNPDGRLYIGSTSELDARVRQHQAGEAGWTRMHGPWELVHTEAFATLAEAVRRERQLKGGRANSELRRRLLDR